MMKHPRLLPVSQVSNDSPVCSGGNRAASATGAQMRGDALLNGTAYCDENVPREALFRSSTEWFLQTFLVLVYYLSVSGFCSQVVGGLLRFPFKPGELRERCLGGVVGARLWGALWFSRGAVGPFGTAVTKVPGGRVARCSRSSPFRTERRAMGYLHGFSSGE